MTKRPTQNATSTPETATVAKPPMRTLAARVTETTLDRINARAAHLQEEHPHLNVTQGDVVREVIAAGLNAVEDAVVVRRAARRVGRGGTEGAPPALPVVA